MISKETLDAVNNGILTDDQLNEAIKHYSTLEKEWVNLLHITYTYPLGNYHNSTGNHQNPSTIYSQH